MDLGGAARASRYRVESCPFFAYGISRDDVVHALGGAGEEAPRLDDVVEKGGHRTLRLALDPGAALSDRNVQAFLERLLEQGCTLVVQLVAVDVPPEVDVAVDRSCRSARRRMLVCGRALALSAPHRRTIRACTSERADGERAAARAGSGPTPVPASRRSPRSGPRFLRSLPPLLARLLLGAAARGEALLRGADRLRRRSRGARRRAVVRPGAARCAATGGAFVVSASSAIVRRAAADLFPGASVQWNRRFTTSVAYAPGGSVNATFTRRRPRFSSSRFASATARRPGNTRIGRSSGSKWISGVPGTARSGKRLSLAPEHRQRGVLRGRLRELRPGREERNVRSSSSRACAASSLAREQERARLIADGHEARHADDVLQVLLHALVPEPALVREHLERAPARLGPEQRAAVVARVLAQPANDGLVPLRAGVGVPALPLAPVLLPERLHRASSDWSSSLGRARTFQGATSKSPRIRSFTMKP